jgi:hypothetical protein
MNKDALVSEAIDLTVDSLTSHLPYTHEKIQFWAKKNGETHNFHKECVKDYAKVISILVQLYE